MNSAGDCPSQKTLRQFALHQLDETVRAQVADHLAECEACSQSLTQLTSSLASPGGQGTIVEAKPTAAPLIAQREGLSETKDAMYEAGSLDDIELKYLLPSSNPQALGRIANYDVLSIVGRGGMGVVLKAFDESLHRIVAIKVLAPELASSPKARRRFVREARAAAAVNHPNVITIHAVDEQAGMPYLVMEYIAGCTLRERIKRLPPLEPLDVMRIGAQIASGLAAAHEQGVIHRDIKPSNVMLEDGLDRVKIADFGLARAAMDLGDITSLGHAVGTPSYVAPEQVTGKEVDARSDLFSLGCLLYALFAGHSPFRGRLVLEVIRQVAEHEPANLAKVDPRVPRHLADLIQKLLQKSPDDRFQSAREVAALLNHEIAVVNQMPSDKLPRLGTPPPSRRLRGPLTVTAFAGALALFVGLLAWRPWQSRSDVEKPAPRTAETPAALHLTVAHDGRGNYRTISEALEHAGRGTVIEVVDKGPYDEAIVIDKAALEGVSLVSSSRALLTAPAGARAVIHIAAPGVTVRGFRFERLSEQHAVWVAGQADGVSLQEIDSKREDSSKWAHVLLSDGAHGAAQRPIEIRGSSFHGGTLGIILLGAKEAPLKSIRIERNEFHGPGMHLQLLQSLEDIRIRGNIFVGGCGAFISLEVPEGSHDILLANNTFFKTSPWLHLLGSSPNQNNVVISNNLILGSDRVEGVELASFLGPWSFNNNWSEPPSDSTEEATGVAERKTGIDLISRDPTSPDFLRPRPDSALSTSGAGGELPKYIGARRN